MFYICSTSQLYFLYAVINKTYECPTSCKFFEETQKRVLNNFQTEISYSKHFPFYKSAFTKLEGNENSFIHIPLKMLFNNKLKIGI